MSLDRHIPGPAEAHPSIEHLYDEAVSYRIAENARIVTHYADMHSSKGLEQPTPPDSMQLNLIPEEYEPAYGEYPRIFRDVLYGVNSDSILHAKYNVSQPYTERSGDTTRTLFKIQGSNFAVYVTGVLETREAIAEVTDLLGPAWTEMWQRTEEAQKKAAQLASSPREPEGRKGHTAKNIGGILKSVWANSKSRPPRQF